MIFLTRKKVQKISLRKIKTARYKSEANHSQGNLEGRSKGHKAFLVRKGIQIKGRLAKRRDHQ